MEDKKSLADKIIGSILISGFFIPLILAIVLDSGFWFISWIVYVIAMIGISFIVSWCCDE